MLATVLEWLTDFLTGHSRPQSPSFLGHVVGKRGALEAAVTGCQKISDIRLRMCRSYKYHCSCSQGIFVPHRSTGGKFFLPELSPESGFFGCFENASLHSTWIHWQFGEFEEGSNRNRENTLLVCRTETINRQTIVWVMSVFFFNPFGEQTLGKHSRRSIYKCGKKSIYASVSQCCVQAQGGIPANLLRSKIWRLSILQTTTMSTAPTPPLHPPPPSRADELP